MRINGFRCDACRKEHLLAVNQTVYSTMGELLPTDWYLVNHGKVEPSKEPLMFCSLQCLSDWVNKQIEPREVVPEEHWENCWPVSAMLRAKR